MKNSNDWPMDRHAGPSRKGRGWRTVLLIGLLTLPLLLDGAKVSYSQWQTMFGPKPMVSTPTFDLLGEYLGRTSRDVSRLSRQPFRHVPWQAEWVVSGLALSLLAGGLILRFNRLR